MSKISIDTPLAELTLRRYEKPKQEGRELVKKVCLSIGLLQPGDSRDIIVDVLSVIQRAKEPLTSKDIEKKVIDERKKNKLPMVGIASSNIRRQIKRLKDVFMVEKVANKYRITEGASLVELFDEKISKFYLDSIIGRVREYFDALDKAK